MKIHWAWLLMTALVAGIAGQAIGRYCEMMKVTQQASMAGQTLADLSRALEGVKLTQGSYPETIGGLKVPTESGDHSEQILSRVKYYRTGEDSYVAFVGIPAVSVLRNGVPPRFER
jgi:hypothetical protein